MFMTSKSEATTSHGWSSKRIFTRLPAERQSPGQGRGQERESNEHGGPTLLVLYYQTLPVKLQPGLGVGERLVFLHYQVDGETRDRRERDTVKTIPLSRQQLFVY